MPGHEKMPPRIASLGGVAVSGISDPVGGISLSVLPDSGI